MSRLELNLAARPFVNLRPVRRAAIFMALVGAALLVANIVLYWRAFAGRGDLRAAEAEVASQIGHEEGLVEELRQELAGVDLEFLGREVGFFNSRIDLRTFPWSALFDDMAEVLPRDVQLDRLTPSGNKSRRNRARRAESTADAHGKVLLTIQGNSRTDEELLAFVDALFAHPRFGDPNLASEKRQEGEAVEFSLTTIYLPAQRTVDSQPIAPVASGDESEQGDALTPASVENEMAETEATSTPAGSSATADATPGRTPAPAPGSPMSRRGRPAAIEIPVDGPLPPDESQLPVAGVAGPDEPTDDLPPPAAEGDV